MPQRAFVYAHLCRRCHGTADLLARAVPSPDHRRSDVVAGPDVVTSCPDYRVRRDSDWFHGQRSALAVRQRRARPLLFDHAFRDCVLSLLDLRIEF